MKILRSERLGKAVRSSLGIIFPGAGMHLTLSSITGLIVILLSVLAAATPSAQATDEHHAHLCSELPTGREFGQHVAGHAQLGHLGEGMNPGHHRGYSPCVPSG